MKELTIEEKARAYDEAIRKRENDMMMLIASFSGKVYSLRAQENRKKRKQDKNNENRN